MDQVSLFMKTWDKLKSDRSTFDSHWDDVARITLPGRTFNEQYSPGQKRNARIFDTTGVWANEQLAGALHSMLTSPSIRWFSLVPEMPGLKLTAPAKAWLDDVTNILYRIFSSPAGMFSSQAYDMYLELTAFGNGVFFSDLRGPSRIVFKAFALADCHFAENDMGEVDMLYRKVNFTAQQAVRFFGDKAPEKIRKLAEEKPMEMVNILHVTEPRRGLSEYGREAWRKPFKGCYIYVDGKTIIEEGGYDTFPYQTPRFAKRSGEMYGFGPGMAAYPDVKMLQRITEVTIRGAEKMVDPPLMLADDSVFGPVVINPGGQIMYRAGSDRPEALQTNGRPDYAFNMGESIRQRVLQHFYVSFLNLPQGPQMTATEVLQRRDEMLRLLGPMLSRQQSEFTGKLIERTYGLAYSNGMLPPVPEELSRVRLKVEYLSPIAQAQRFTEIDSITRSLQMGAYLAQFDPAVMQNFDPDETLRYTSLDINNVPQRIMRTPEVVAGIRKQQQDAQAAMQQAQLAEINTKASKNSANAAKFLGQTAESA